MDTDPLPFPPSASPVIAPPMFHPFPSLLFFPASLKFSKEVWGNLKRQPVAKVGGDQIHLVPVISNVRGDASHGSHKSKSKVGLKYTDIAVRNVTLPHRYGTETHMPYKITRCYLPPDRASQRCHSRLYPSRSWYSIKRPRRDARLS